MICHMLLISADFSFWKEDLKDLQNSDASFLSLSMSALDQRRIDLLIGFFGLKEMLLSKSTAWWSLVPEITEVFLVKLLLFVKKRSKILSSLVGELTVWVRQDHLQDLKTVDLLEGDIGGWWWCWKSSWYLVH